VASPGVTGGVALRASSSATRSSSPVIGSHLARALGDEGGVDPQRRERLAGLGLDRAVLIRKALAVWASVRSEKYRRTTTAR
jgi:hypothetical protein